LIEEMTALQAKHETEMREKNENIFNLNNLLNEKYEAQASNKDEVQKKEKEN